MVLIKETEEGAEINIPASQRFELIKSVIDKFKLKNKVRYLCKVAGVSPSGYYHYFSLASLKRRKQRERQDEMAKEKILKAFNYKRRKKGARQIKITLDGEFMQCISITALLFLVWIKL